MIFLMKGELCPIFDTTIKPSSNAEMYSSLVDTVTKWRYLFNSGKGKGKRVRETLCIIPLQIDLSRTLSIKII